jgi:uncharacterized membrane protein YeaQ/YmgE (transglycosylase-associated protein family)
MSLFLFLFIGLVAGWLANTLYKGSGSGLLMNMLLGVVGSVMGRMIFKLLGLNSSNWVGTIVMSTVGALVILWLYNRYFGK